MTTQARLKELFDYDPETGLFTRKVAVSASASGRVMTNLNTGGHVQFAIDRHLYQAHRLAWLYVNGSFPSGFIDHINGVKTDNRIANLRDATRSINAQNLREARSDNKQKLLGVCWKKANKKFVAQIQVDGRVRHLGLFEDATDAHSAYISAKRQYHIGCTI